jgi:hypothetical protein
VADDRVAAAAAELYGADPAAFTGRRGELAAAARTAGDREAARAITALRKPTRTAWVVNTLARADPGAPAKLAELAAALRAAEQAKDGQRLRELSAARGPLIDALTGQALATADVLEPPPSLRAEVAATLTAALADPDVYDAFAAGRLTTAVQWAGFGLAAEAAGLDGVVDAGADADLRVPRAAREPGPEPQPRPIATVTPLSRSRSPGSAGRPHRDAPGPPESRAPAPSGATARRVAEAAERLAREAGERAAAARERYDDAERTAATASAASAEAVAAEDRLEGEVRDLEERLIRARDDLAAARTRARRAEAAERRARQVFDRLPPPE